MFRQEHPTPQFMRDEWINLNGKWDFEFDYSNSGEARKLYEPTATFSKKIEVPFCPESELSGIAEKDFLNSVWYKRDIDVTEKQLKGRVILHFGAVDYFATVYVNGKKCATHKGGYVSFSTDITDCLQVGKNVLTVHAEDDTRDMRIPAGKQSKLYASYGCYYTRTTGIWQTVWLEFVPNARIEYAKYYADVDACSMIAKFTLIGQADLKVTALFNGKVVGQAEVKDAHGDVILPVALSEKHLWELGQGDLYDLELSFGEDKVKSYFGLRKIEFQGKKFLLNGKSVFQRLILDQGFYPDGIYTAPTDDELLNDIKRSMAMGFNGARLHQKVFEERFLYHADKMGYMVWGEYPSWGIDHTDSETLYGVLPEWLEEVKRDFNHPAIVGWCPLNETWDYEGRKQYDDLVKLVYLATKSADDTRPCIDTSGNFHVVTDIYDIHDYTQNPEDFAKTLVDMKDNVYNDRFAPRQTYDGKLPFFVSEYGGIAFNTNEGWGYGDAPKDEKEFLDRLKGLTDAILDNGYIFGFCYTQLTNVEQEQNGLYTYDRKPKFDEKIIHAIISKKSAIED